MSRLTGWREALYEYLSDNAKTPFQPGFFDCSLFSADCVLAMTGVDYGADYRGNYYTVEEGLALLAANGFESHVAYVESLFTEVPVLRARCGDLALVIQGNQAGIGVVLGATVAVVTLRGISQLPLSAAVRAFQVPD